MCRFRVSFFFLSTTRGSQTPFECRFSQPNVASFPQPTAKGLICSLFFPFNIFEIQTDIYWQHFPWRKSLSAFQRKMCGCLRVFVNICVVEWGGMGMCVTKEYDDWRHWNRIDWSGLQYTFNMKRKILRWWRKWLIFSSPGAPAVETRADRTSHCIRVTLSLFSARVTNQNEQRKANDDFLFGPPLHSLHGSGSRKDAKLDLNKSRHDLWCLVLL